MSAGSLTITAEDRRGEHFSKNRYPEASIQDAPSEIRATLALMSWAKSRSYIPRLASPPRVRLAELFDAVNEGIEEVERVASEQLEEAEKRMEGVLEKNWELIELSLIKSEARDTAKKSDKA